MFEILTLGKHILKGDRVNGCQITELTKSTTAGNRVATVTHPNGQSISVEITQDKTYTVNRDALSGQDLPISNLLTAIEELRYLVEQPHLADSVNVDYIHAYVSDGYAGLR